MRAINFLIVGILFLVSLCSQAQCLLLVGKNTLVSTTVNGQSYYAAPKTYIDQLQCVDPDFLKSESSRVIQLQQLIMDYKNISEDLGGRIKSYQELLSGYDNTLNNSVELTNKYDMQVARYQTLSQDYYQLVEKYDALSQKYRSIAINSITPFSFDLGIGANDEGKAAGLVGVSYRKIKVWGVFQDDHSALMFGRSFSF